MTTSLQKAVKTGESRTTATSAGLNRTENPRGRLNGECDGGNIFHAQTQQLLRVGRHPTG